MTRFVILCPLLIALSSLCGCEILQVLSAPEKPSARIAAVRIRDLDLVSTTLLFDVEVSNPLATAIPLVNLNYGIESRGKSFLSGKADVQGTIPAKESKVVTVPARVVFKDLLTILQDVKLGSVIPYTANLVLGIDVPAVGPLELPLTRTGELPVPTVPSVDLASVKWENLSFQQATALLDLHVVNRNDFPIDLSALSYAISLGNVEVGKGSLQKATSFREGGSGQIPIRVSFAPAQLGLAAFNMLTGKGAAYAVAGTLQCKTPFGPLDLPYERSGQTQFTK